MEGCGRCQSKTVCLECKAFYYVNMTTNLCQRCRTTLEGCDYCYDETGCESCGMGYFLNLTTKFCQLCGS